MLKNIIGFTYRIGSTITGKPIVYIVAHKLGEKKVIKINMTSKKLN